MFAALSCAATMVIQIPIATGYLNFGDGLCLLAGWILGLWYGFAAGCAMRANFSMSSTSMLGLAAGAGGLPRAGADAAVREKLYLKKYRFLRLFIESESAIIRVFFGREVP